MNTIAQKQKTAAQADWRQSLERVADQIETTGHDCDITGQFVAKNLDLLDDLGLFALGVPAELGGGGALYAEVCAMLRAVGRLDGSTALTLSMHTHQVMVAEWRRRVQGAPTDAVLKKVAWDRLRIVSSGGSDWLSGSGRAEKAEGGYRIFARKVFSSGAASGDVMNTSAVYQHPETGQVVLHFALPMKAPGVRVLSNWDSLGMRGTGSQDVQIDGAFIPDEAVTGQRPPGKWHPMFHLITLIAFPLIYSVYAGVADKAREIALSLAVKRAQDDAGLMAVGELENAHAATALAVEALVETGAAAAPTPATTNRIMSLRALAARSAIEVGTKALEAAGGAGFYREAGLERRFRDLQAARFHPLQDRQQQLYAGRFALGLDIDG